MITDKYRCPQSVIIRITRCGMRSDEADPCIPNDGNEKNFGDRIGDSYWFRISSLACKRETIILFTGVSIP
jgi:hypothetical protein